MMYSQTTIYSEDLFNSMVLEITRRIMTDRISIEQFVAETDAYHEIFSQMMLYPGMYGDPPRGSKVYISTNDVESLRAAQGRYRVKGLQMHGTLALGDSDSGLSLQSSIEELYLMAPPGSHMGYKRFGWSVPSLTKYTSVGVNRLVDNEILRASGESLIHLRIDVHDVSELSRPPITMYHESRWPSLRYVRMPSMDFNPIDFNNTIEYLDVSVQEPQRIEGSMFGEEWGDQLTTVVALYTGSIDSVQFRRIILYPSLLALRCTLRTYVIIPGRRPLRSLHIHLDGPRLARPLIRLGHLYDSLKDLSLTSSTPDSNMTLAIKPEYFDHLLYMTMSRTEDSERIRRGLAYNVQFDLV